MPDFVLSLPAWLVWLGMCSITVLALLPIWYVSHSRRRQQSLRLETILWRADKLLQSAEPLDLKISELKQKNFFLHFSNGKIYYKGKKNQWEILFTKVKSWNIYDVHGKIGSDFSNSMPFLWNIEFKDSKYAYTLDASFIENSESLELIKAACVRAFGSNAATPLEGLRLELARSERLLHKINSGNINMMR
jgi:hypothetical protein